MEIIVLAKQVPDTKRITGQAMKEDGTVNRAALPAIFNPEDLNALEMALGLRDRYGGRVTVITMGPPQATEILRQSLYRGADRVILLSDSSFAGADTLATSYTLSLAIKKIANYDLVICGRQAIDGDTAQVGPQVAEKLKLMPITYVEEVQWIKDKRIRAKRNLGHGYEVVEGELPLLMTVVSQANLPRPPRAKLLLQKGFLLEEWDINKLGIDKAICGMAGSPTRVHKIESIVLSTKGFKEFKPREEEIKGLMLELAREHTFD